MRVLYSLMLLCAVDWYRPDGTKVNSGGFLFTKQEAILFAGIQLPENPGYTYEIRCEER